VIFVAPLHLKLEIPLKLCESKLNWEKPSSKNMAQEARILIRKQIGVMS